MSTAAWLRSRLRAGGAGPRVQVAKALADLPEVAAAFGRGEISFTRARIAAKTARDLDREVLAGGVDKLLAEAAEQPPARFAQAAVRIRDHYNPDAADTHTRDLHTQWLDVDKTFGGAVSISGVLAPDGYDSLPPLRWARSSTTDGRGWRSVAIRAPPASDRLHDEEDNGGEAEQGE